MSRENDDTHSPLDLSLIACAYCTNISPRHTYEIIEESGMTDGTGTILTFSCSRCATTSVVVEYPIGVTDDIQYL